MRTRFWIGSLLVAIAAFVAGCPINTNPPPPAAAVLEGEWDVEGSDGHFHVFFNDQGQVTRIEGETEGGDTATLNIQNATTELDGSDAVITIPTATGDVTFNATLSEDENTLTGTLSREINIGGDLQLVISAGTLTLEREDGDDDDDDETEFHATLAGANEVPPVTSNTTGEATFEVTENGVEFTLTVNNGVGITQAHIHIGSATVNGPVVVFLFGPDADGMDINGVLATGTITPDDFAGDLEGEDLSALVDELIAGNAYVNVHSLTNPSGESRGQIEADDDSNGDNGDDGDN